jgi:hypothetical protein
MLRVIENRAGGAGLCDDTVGQDHRAVGAGARELYVVCAYEQSASVAREGSQ